MSNKNSKAETIVLKEVIRLTVFQNMVKIVEAFEEREGATSSSMSSESVNDSESETVTRVTTVPRPAPRDLDGIEDNSKQKYEDEEEILASEDNSKAPEMLTGSGIMWPKE